ncbi:hypothetical protein HYALB_00012987 [Hymenoscyphus albidus]|uniref:Uncharacterized protein n=1 Tax=Hymenoscyphus albidus TaxID=595503 RepID=A0A9N9LSY0_9HELO|nr:hypothetical protein HYALB_00012987 [Hymenoscyphus albidus]
MGARGNRQSDKWVQEATVNLQSLMAWRIPGRVSPLIIVKLLHWNIGRESLIHEHRRVAVGDTMSLPQSQKTSKLLEKCLDTHGDMSKSPVLPQACVPPKFSAEEEETVTRPILTSRDCSMWESSRSSLSQNGAMQDIGATERDVYNWLVTGSRDLSTIASNFSNPQHLFM